jgi:cytochrome c-type biogenesis protein CcmF
VIAAWYGLTALWLAPFAATPVEWLAESPSQGMNAHLMKPWMLFHAPLVLAAYAWTLALAAPALDALRGRSTSWPDRARLHARRAWVVLTAGIGFGMLWAFEDAMYGQVWHWDPVQTAVFCLWCLLGAHLHGVAGWGVGRRHWRTTPCAAALAASAVPLVMAVTRNPMLASSHRYVGADSWVSHVVLGTALLVAAIVCAIAGWRAGAGLPCARARPSFGPSSGLGLWLVQICFLLAAVAAAGQLLFAFGASALALPRPEEDKPFLAMLSNLTTGAELAALRAAFEQWDVDGYVLARGLLLPLAGFGLVGGWYFFRRLSNRAGLLSLLLAVAAMGAIAVWGGLMTRSYAGAGILSQQIVAVLPLLDASLVAGAYLALGGIAWAAAVLRRRGRKGFVAAVPLAAIHVGVALALWGGLLATALNSYTQHEIRFDGVQTAWARDRHGYAFRLADVRVAALRDGGVSAANGVQALTTIEVRGPAGEVLDGQTLYRDSRAPPERYDGPLRQICELLDYRYARHVGTPGYLLQPLIDQGWANAVQFWVSPAAVVESLEDRPGGTEMFVVVKVFPFLSLLWAGLLLVLFGSGWLAFFRRREPG